MVRFCGASDPILFNEEVKEKILTAMSQFNSYYMPVHRNLALAICVFGILTNVIHIVVLTEKSMRSNAINCFLTAVAVCDIGVMVSYLAYLIYFIYLPTDRCFIGRYYGWVVFAVAHVFISIYLHSTSLWFVIAVGFMRVMALRQRTLNHRWQSPKLALKIGVVISITVFLLTLPNLALSDIKKLNVHESRCGDKVSNNSNVTIPFYVVRLSKMARESGCQMLKLDLLIVGVLFKIIPCIFVAITSILLLRRVEQRSDAKRSLTLSEYRTVSLPSDIRRPSRSRISLNIHDRTTIMLQSILMLFLFTELPQGIVATASGIFTEDVYFYLYGGIADVLDLLALINSSVNFLLYCLMSSNYRKVFCQVIIPRSCANYPSNSTTAHFSTRLLERNSPARASVTATLRRSRRSVV